ncbi:helix-turn-helix domain-containing protein [uncultured Oscillibacter sp.]|uniref:helix-turn-helix domain-containing protein n=1 Tax=uncultured Oscillibacter sp. TaxID=876091 RepID=UPI00342EF2CE
MTTKFESCGGIDSLPEFCTLADLSLILPISRATLYRMAEQKRIPSLRIGRRVIIPRETLKKWIEQECGIPGNASMGVI